MELMNAPVIEIDLRHNQVKWVLIRARNAPHSRI